jgi:hypothetical protein
VGEVSHKLGITEQTYYRWRRECGGMRVDQARRLKELKDISKLLSGNGVKILLVRGARGVGKTRLGIE